MERRSRALVEIHVPIHPGSFRMDRGRATNEPTGNPNFPSVLPKNMGRMRVEEKLILYLAGGTPSAGVRN